MKCQSRIHVVPTPLLSLSLLVVGLTSEVQSFIALVDTYTLSLLLASVQPRFSLRLIPKACGYIITWVLKRQTCPHTCTQFIGVQFRRLRPRLQSSLHFRSYPKFISFCSRHLFILSQCKNIPSIFNFYFDIICFNINMC